MEVNNTISRTNKEGKIYVSNKDLLHLILLSKERDELTKEAVSMFMLMIKNIATKKKYPSTDEMEDVYLTAMLDCLLYWRGFNPAKSENPFAYYSSLIINGLAKGWNMLHPENKKAKGCIFTSIDNNIHSI